MDDLSNLAQGSLGTAAGSMAAGNSVSERPLFGAPGSASEQVQPSDVVAAVDPVGPVAGDGTGPADRHVVHASDEPLRQGHPAWTTTGGGGS